MQLANSYPLFPPDLHNTKPVPPPGPRTTQRPPARPESLMYNPSASRQPMDSSFAEGASSPPEPQDHL
ncbi:hypothetical protein HYDPIDRAFT_119071 [Hydnomerulius pinastri MD-312]|uniref:Uncharacterized protein n=1 Tax=Hydnomerulius pinastri MD-312 TaxID=994086 RepID=A0A0C9VZF9_9AGAM|nr:hypothetical protein HYDPIDRAFT_119071 [Hydnomerulius pinastri MD-312]